MEMRMGIVRVAAIVSLAAVLLFSGVYAGGFENADVGLRARGMGGAFRAIALSLCECPVIR